MALTTIYKVRLLTDITSSQVSDNDIDGIIKEATKEILSEINVKVIREKIAYIDATRENDIDGSNTTYYVKNWEGKYISDSDMDGDVDSSDITVNVVNSSDVESEATVSSVTYDSGKFVLDTAYTSTDTLYVTYSWSYYDTVTPDPLIGLAATYLVAAYSYLKRDAGVGGNVRFGNVSISKSLSASYGAYMNKYKQLMSQIKSKNISGGVSGLSVVHI